MAVKGSEPPEGTIVPHFVVPDAGQAAKFYETAFGAVVLYRSPSPTGAGEHIHLRIFNSLMWIASEELDQPDRALGSGFLASPLQLGGSTTVFQTNIPDVDQTFQQAIDAGAEMALPLTDMFWGDRYGWVRDPFGHIWALCTVKEILSPEEVQNRMRKVYSE
jgi:PhnB protein